jgi:hypothetical protein
MMSTTSGIIGSSGRTLLRSSITTKISATTGTVIATAMDANVLFMPRTLLLLRGPVCIVADIGLDRSDTKRTD